MLFDRCLDWPLYMAFAANIPMCVRRVNSFLDHANWRGADNRTRLNIYYGKLKEIYDSFELWHVGLVWVIGGGA